MAEMIIQLEESNRELELQRGEIKRLREQVQHLLSKVSQPRHSTTSPSEVLDSLPGIGSGGDQARPSSRETPGGEPKALPPRGPVSTRLPSIQSEM